MSIRGSALLWTAVLLLAVIAVPSVRAERKALVIGNAGYAEGRLPNPGHDADDMKARLEALGFEVTLVKDADKRAMVEALERLTDSLRPDDHAVFY